MKMKAIEKLKGMAMFSFAIGLVTLMVGVSLMYILPEFVIATISATGTFNATAIALARAQTTTVQGVGFAVIVLSLVWLIIAVIGGGKGK
jgi:hypothetical protein